MLAEPEPQREIPIPSPHPSSALGSSSLLDLTPEKPPPPPPPPSLSHSRRRRSNNRIKPVVLKQHNFPHLSRAFPPSQDNISPVTPIIGAEGGRELSIPALYSSSSLYVKLHEYTKTQREERDEVGEGDNREVGLELSSYHREDPLPPAPLPPLTLPHSSSPAFVEPTDQDTKSNKVNRRSEGVTVTEAQEKKRYTDLVSVDVSDDSFQKLTTCPRKKTSRFISGGGRKSNSISSPTPNIMDFFSSNLEVEEVTVQPLPPLPPIQPAAPSFKDALTLYHFVYGE